MLLSDRRTFLLGLAALPLAACGFQPAYGTKGQAEAIRGKISLQAPTDRNSFELTDQLARRLGAPQVAAYELRFLITTSQERLAVTEAEITTGYNVLGRVDFTLVDSRSGQIATQGSVNQFATYSSTANAVATRAAASDAKKRLMVMLADEITTRLIATSGNWAT